LRHEKLGPLYRESFGPDVSILWAGDARLCEEVFRQDGRHPAHFIPEAWLVQSERSGRKRGLFFLDGEEWARWRRAMNSVFLKDKAKEWCVINCNGTCGDVSKLNIICSTSWMSIATDDLTRDWDQVIEKASSTTPVQVPNLEQSLHTWSVKVTLAALFGARMDRIDLDVETFVDKVKAIFEASGKLQFLSAEQEAQNNTGKS
jgi:hypothetical protein